jgi:hypothetical protein
MTKPQKTYAGYTLLEMLDLVDQSREAHRAAVTVQQEELSQVRGNGRAERRQREEITRRHAPAIADCTKMQSRAADALRAYGESVGITMSLDGPQAGESVADYRSAAILHAEKAMATAEEHARSAVASAGDGVSRIERV